MFSNTVSRPDPALNPSNDPSCHMFTEELRTFIRACKCFVHAIGFYSPQFRFLAKKKKKKLTVDDMKSLQKYDSL